MCITEEKLVEAYGNSNPHERFLLIYKNYSIFPQLVDCYETGLFNRILFEVEYNRRKKNDDDLGVRIQTSHRSDPTAAKAIEHIMIRDAIEECNFSGNILKETDDPEKHKRDILTIHMMRRDTSLWKFHHTDGREVWGISPMCPYIGSACYFGLTIQRKQNNEK